MPLVYTLDPLDANTLSHRHSTNAANTRRIAMLVGKQVRKGSNKCARILLDQCVYTGMNESVY
jgi:hypothetical protein